MALFFVGVLETQVLESPRPSSAAQIKCRAEQGVIGRLIGERPNCAVQQDDRPKPEAGSSADQSRLRRMLSLTPSHPEVGRRIASIPSSFGNVADANRTRRRFF
jgi:hypothetical protein